MIDVRKNEFEVIVLTYNRADFLYQQLESICGQTAIGFPITVLDNASTDHTLEVIRTIQSRFPERRVVCSSNGSNIGGEGNLKRSQDVATADYVMVLHDDDLIHPQYVEFVVKATRAYPDVVVVGSRIDMMYNISNNNWINYSSIRLKRWSASANPMVNLFRFRLNLSSVTYKTKIYQQIQYKASLYGKLIDIPFLAEISNMGETIYLAEDLLRYRCHAGQDSNAYSTGPFAHEVMNVLKSYQEYAQGKFFYYVGLYNFGHFLFKWSRLKGTWESFVEYGVQQHVFPRFLTIIFRNDRVFSFLQDLGKKLVRVRLKSGRIEW